jgi:hypothetical protein
MTPEESVIATAVQSWTLNEDFLKNPLRNRLAVLMNRTGHLSYHLGQAALAPK